MTKNKTGKQLNSQKQWYDHYYQTDEQHLKDKLDQLMSPIRVHHPNEFRELISINKILWERGEDIMKDKTIAEKIKRQEEKQTTGAPSTDRVMYQCGECQKSFHPSVSISDGKLRCPYCGSPDVKTATDPLTTGGPPPAPREEPTIDDLVDDYLEQPHEQPPDQPRELHNPTPVIPKTDRDKRFWQLVNELEIICNEAEKTDEDDTRIIDQEDTISALELVKVRQLKKIFKEEF